MILLDETERAVLVEMLERHAEKWAHHAVEARDPFVREANRERSVRWAVIAGRLANGEGVDATAVAR